ncbi:putative calcium-dependent protein kinase 17-like isoform X1 [Capsicum annuum]|nr:putative calcium-dependent protein kinase 17-like isoform X1 [Capsicum annuum]
MFQQQNLLQVQKNGYRSVPQFGMWDQQDAGGGAASYTIEFSKARVNRKQHKKNDLLARPPSIDHEQEALRKQHEDSCMRGLSFVWVVTYHSEAFNWTCGAEGSGRAVFAKARLDQNQHESLTRTCTRYHSGACILSWLLRIIVRFSTGPRGPRDPVELYLLRQEEKEYVDIPQLLH